MITGKVIYGVLNADTAVKAAVSTKIYPHIAPQGVVFPVITFRTLQMLPSPSKNNQSLVDLYEVEINVYDKDYTNACTLHDKVRDALHLYKGTVNTVKVQHIVFESSNDGYVEDANVHFVQSTYSMRIQTKYST